MNQGIRSHLLCQAGVISRAQALTGGLSERQIEGLLSTGEWLTARRGIYRLHAAVPTPETGLRVASLWLGEKALLAEEGAAWWWGLVENPPQTWCFATNLHRKPHAGVRLLDVGVAAEDRCQHRGVPVLSRPLALLRAAVIAEQREKGRGITLIDRAKLRRDVSQRDLELTFLRQRGGHGTTTMRELVSRTGDGAHSELERMAVRLLKAAGVRGFTLNLWTTLRNGRRFELDIAFPERRFAIELDGYAYHSSPEAQRADLRRANELMADGWTIRRFTYSDLLSDPDRFVAIVLEVLRG